MDNVIDRGTYPLEAQRQEALNKRRMGMGVMGAANAVEAIIGKPSYGDPEFLLYLGEILKVLKNDCYRS